MRNPIPEQEASDIARRFLEGVREELEMKDPRFREKVDRGLLAWVVRQGEALPPDMADRAADYILNKKVKRSSGRTKDQFAPRNFTISIAVYLLVKKGLYATSNEYLELDVRAGDHDKTACHIVAEVLSEMFPDKKEFPRSYPSVKRIWNRYKHMRGDT